MARPTGEPRDPAKERAWRRRMADYARSGLPVADFCRREGLTPHAFRGWRQELARGIGNPHRLRLASLEADRPRRHRLSSRCGSSTWSRSRRGPRLRSRSCSPPGRSCESPRASIHRPSGRS